jgi:hypothetical protein
MTHNDLRYEFGPHQLDPSKGILTRDGESSKRLSEWLNDAVTMKARGVPC